MARLPLLLLLHAHIISLGSRRGDASPAARAEAYRDGTIVLTYLSPLHSDYPASAGAVVVGWDDWWSSATQTVEAEAPHDRHGSFKVRVPPSADLQAELLSGCIAGGGSPRCCADECIDSVRSLVRGAWLKSASRAAFAARVTSTDVKASPSAFPTGGSVVGMTMGVVMPDSNREGAHVIHGPSSSTGHLPSITLAEPKLFCWLALVSGDDEGGAVAEEMWPPPPPSPPATHTTQRTSSRPDPIHACIEYDQKMCDAPRSSAAEGATLKRGASVPRFATCYPLHEENLDGSATMARPCMTFSQLNPVWHQLGPVRGHIWLVRGGGVGGGNASGGSGGAAGAGSSSARPGTPLPGTRTAFETRIVDSRHMHVGARLMPWSRRFGRVTDMSPREVNDVVSSAQTTSGDDGDSGEAAEAASKLTKPPLLRLVGGDESHGHLLALSQARQALHKLGLDPVHQCRRKRGIYIDTCGNTTLKDLPASSPFKESTPTPPPLPPPPPPPPPHTPPPLPRTSLNESSLLLPPSSSERAPMADAIVVYFMGSGEGGDSKADSLLQGWLALAARTRIHLLLIVCTMKAPRVFNHQPPLVGIHGNHCPDGERVRLAQTAALTLIEMHHSVDSALARVVAATALADAANVTGETRRRTRTAVAILGGERENSGMGWEINSSACRGLAKHNPNLPANPAELRARCFTWATEHLSLLLLGKVVSFRATKNDVGDYGLAIERTHALVSDVVLSSSRRSVHTQHAHAKDVDFLSVASARDLVDWAELIGRQDRRRGVDAAEAHDDVLTDLVQAAIKTAASGQNAHRRAELLSWEREKKVVEANSWGTAARPSWGYCQLCRATGVPGEQDQTTKTVDDVHTHRDEHNDRDDSSDQTLVFSASALSHDDTFCAARGGLVLACLELERFFNIRCVDDCLSIKPEAYHCELLKCPPL